MPDLTLDEIDLVFSGNADDELRERVREDMQQGGISKERYQSWRKASTGALQIEDVAWSRFEIPSFETASWLAAPQELLRPENAQRAWVEREIGRVLDHVVVSLRRAQQVALDAPMSERESRVVANAIRHLLLPPDAPARQQCALYLAVARARRRQRRELDETVASANDSTLHAHQDYSAKEQDTQIEQIRNGECPEQADAFDLHYFAQRTVAEIAELMGVDERAAKLLLAIARDRIVTHPA